MLSRNQIIVLAAILLIVVPMALTAGIMSKTMIGVCPGKYHALCSDVNVGACSDVTAGLRSDMNVEHGSNVLR